MRKIYLFIFFFVALFFTTAISQSSYAKKTLLLTGSHVTYQLDSTYLEKIEWTENGSFRVLSNERLFIHNPVTSAPYWYRLTVTNQSKENKEWILVSYFYSIDEIDLWVEDKNGHIEKQYYRDTMSVYDRPIQHKQPSFPLSIATGETKTIYIKVKNESTYEYAFGLFSPFHFFSTYLREYYLIGLFYGFMLFILIYSLINYAFFKDRVLFFYILFIVSQITHMLFRDGYGVLIFPGLTEYADVVKNLSRASISVTILIYTLSFLNLPRKSPVFYFVLTFILARIAYALIMLGDTSILTFHFELFAILISTGLSLNAYFKNDIDAKYMVVGLSFMSIAYFVFYLSVVWVSAIGNIGYFIIYFGIAAECIFTTLALTERFKRIQIDNYNKKTLTKELELSVTKRTELIALQNKLLEEQTAELNSFLYSASHDLSGPIKSLYGLLYLAKKDPEANLTELHQMMEEKLHILENNVSDLNAVSILKNKTASLSPIDFTAIHYDTIKKFDATIKANAIYVTLDLNVKTPIVDDGHSITIIYHHIVSNAIKFYDSTKNPFLNISVECNDNVVCLTFADNGIGIEADNLEKIFNMFYRGNTRSKNDIGIGLYITKLAAMKLGGDITVESILGKGSVFKVSFPLK